jgi:hypothetical protein
MSSLFDTLVMVSILVLGGIAITLAMPDQSAQSSTTSGLEPLITGVGYAFLAGTLYAGVKAAKAVVGGLS